jgi:hypothetical protein
MKLYNFHNFLKGFEIIKTREASLTFEMHFINFTGRLQRVDFEGFCSVLFKISKEKYPWEVDLVKAVQTLLKEYLLFSNFNNVPKSARSGDATGSVLFATSRPDYIQEEVEEANEENLDTEKKEFEFFTNEYERLNLESKFDYNLFE